MSRIALPIKGVTTAVAADAVPAGYAPPQGLRNVVPLGQAAGTNELVTLGTRPRLRKWSARQLGKPGSRAVQGLLSMSRASAVTSYQLGQEIQQAGGRAQSAGLASGSAWALPTGERGTALSMKVTGTAGQASVTVAGVAGAQPCPTTTGFPANGTPAWVSADPTGELAVVAYSWTDAGTHRTLLVVVRPSTGSLVGTRLVPAGAGASNVACVGPAWCDGGMIVARGTALYLMPTANVGPRLVPTGPSTLAAVTVSNAWSAPMGLVAALTGSGSTLLVAHLGDETGGVTLNPAGSITAGACARFFRAGVARLSIDIAEAAAVVERLGPPPASTDAYVEAAGSAAVDHPYLRFAQVLDRAPRGALPLAIAAGPAGSFAVAFTNSGWGPTVSFTPDAGAHLPTTLAVFDADGALVWEEGTESAIATEAGGKLTGVGTTYFCDIPDEDGANAGTTSHDGPALRAVVVDGAGVVFAAGRVHASRHNVFAYDAAGTPRWRTRTESNNPTSGSPAWVAAGAAGRGTPAGCLAIDPGDSSLIVGGARNLSWQDADSPTGPYAWLFKVATADGSIVWTGSLTQDDAETDPLGLAACVGFAVAITAPYTDS